MRRVCWAIAAAMALAAAPAHALEAERDALFAAPTTADSIGRVVAPVIVNGQGPFRFVIDTGANRTVLAPHLAARLGIDVRAAPQQLVHGVTGAEPAPIVRVAEVRVGRLARRDLDLPVLSNRLHAGVDGTLGADHLQGGRLLVDFTQNRVVLQPTPVSPPRRFIVERAQMRFGQLPLISARIGRISAKAVIDTGAERSIGNNALRRALEAEGDRVQPDGFTTVYGAVGQDATAQMMWVRRLVVGGVRVDRLPVLFADTHFFTLWEIEREPALLIGMDVIGQLDALMIDYRRGEVGFLLPRGIATLDSRSKGSRL